LWELERPLIMPASFFNTYRLPCALAALETQTRCGLPGHGPFPASPATIMQRRSQALAMPTAP
ncbi:hypothetical protein BAE44_0016028, partial [Dichanthelium oligosanthes]